MTESPPVVKAIIAALGGETKARAILGLPRVTADLGDVRSRIEFYSKWIDKDLVEAFNALDHPYVRRLRDRILDLMDMGRVVGCPDSDMVIVMRMICNMQEADEAYSKRGKS